MINKLHGLDVKGPGSVRAVARNDATATSAVIVFDPGGEEREAAVVLEPGRSKEVLCEHERNGTCPVRARVRGAAHVNTGPAMLALRA